MQITFGQAPNIDWQNRIGGSNVNILRPSQQTDDGGFIVGGYSNSNISGDKTENSKGLYDYWIVKTNISGIVEWDKTIGGNAPNGLEQDILTGISQTIDKGFIIIGYSDSPLSGDKTEEPIGSVDFWIVKTDNFGNVEWQNTIGGTDAEEPYTLVSTIDQGYLIGGYSLSDISGDKTQNSRGLHDYWIVKLNNEGIIEWDKTIGGNGNDILSKIIQLEDGSYILGGRSNSNISGEKTENSKGGNDLWIMKIDTSGNIIWQKTIGGSGDDNLSNITQTINSNFLLSGYSDSNISGDKTENCRGFYDYWIVEIDSIGNILWQKTIGGNQEDTLFSAIQCNDGNYLLAGSSRSSISGEKTDALYGVGGTDAWVVKLDSLGTIIWQKTIGGIGDDGFSYIVQTNDDGFFFAGGTSSPLSGNIVEAPIGIYDYWILKLEPDNLSNPDNTSISNIQIYPNPTNGIINLNFGSSQEDVSISIINLLGQVVSTAQFNQITEKQIQIVGQTGVYFLEIKIENHSKKVIKIIKN